MDTSKIAVIHFVFAFAVLMSCDKGKDLSEPLSDPFVLTSPAIGQDSLLPVAYTCDGESATLPLVWSGYPVNTESFALIMHHEASPTDIHWYWILFNLPASVHSLPKNVSGIGTLGSNSVNGNTGYSPPCSQGPGFKTYVFNVYALSETLEINVSPEKVTRDVLLDMMDGHILSTAALYVKYSRNIDEPLK
jgi:Raf kinase inhibitor-like YbhB/YbcL family protein